MMRPQAHGNVGALLESHDPDGFAALVVTASHDRVDVAARGAG